MQLPTPSAAHAPAKTPEDRRAEFVAVEGGQETASAPALLVSAYLVMWALLLGFVLLAWRRTGRLEQRLSSLEQALARHDGQRTD